MVLFNDIRDSLANSPEQRQNIANVARVASYISTGLTGYLGVVAAVTFLASPIFGLLGAAFYAAGALVTREIMIVSRNTADLFQGNNIANGLDRAFAMLSAQEFVDAETKDTWFLKPFLSNHIVECLSQDDRGFLDWLIPNN